MDVSIIVVNYNTKDLIRNCLNSIYKQTKEISFEVIVSDNYSTDGSIEMIKSDFPQVILIENNANLGFGAANNRGLDIARGKYIFYLNSDTVLLNNAVKMFFDYFEKADSNEQIGALGANLLDKNKNITISYASFPTVENEIFAYIRKIFITGVKIIFPLIRNKTKQRKHLFYTGDVDYICGADLFVKNNELAKFDETFFLYYEETDLQFKMSKKGLKRILIDGPEIIHLEGGSNKTQKNIHSYISISNQFKDISRVLYLRKNVSKNAGNILKILTFLYWTQPFFIFETKKNLKLLKNV